jgi:GNAT superfamily N-acetyltransferase
MSDGKLTSDLFSEKLLNKYSIEQISKKSFYALFEEKFFQYFEEMIYFNHDAIFDNYIPCEQKIPFEFKIEPFCLVIYDKEIPIALFKGHPNSANAYSMDFSAVHHLYRRKGIYSALMDIILNYTKHAGFSTVNSSHSLNNNDILIAKLKKGFRLTALTISPEFGPIASLSYFHNPSYEKAFLYRCGQVEMNRELIENARGTLHAFNKLLNKCINSK